MNIVERIRDARDNHGQVFVCGNGGSSANAEHFTNDLFSKGVKAICLNSNTSIVTMIANDFGYKYVFSKQLELYYNPADLVVLISCSGTSKNILQVLKKDYNFIKIFGGKGTYGDMESAHSALLHKISEAI
ncbi:MAG: SIS domain-containing protein [Candidatus Izemoplasmatales bacterium]